MVVGAPKKNISFQTEVVDPGQNSSKLWQSHLTCKHWRFLSKERDILNWLLMKSTKLKSAKMRSKCEGPGQLHKSPKFA